MPIETRSRSKLPSPGPFLAEVTNHLDPSYMGGMEVALKKGIPNNINIQADTYHVKYLNPFYGATSVRFEGNNSGSFNDVQKSYGMWMIPPDVGTTVMVIFIDGDPNQGYWMGCVQDKYQNHMVPGIAASQYTALTSEQRKKYGTTYLPVAEFNKRTQTGNNPNTNTIPKPVHPFADRLLAQGLLLDTIRGVTSSSARREVPSGVFGISTPGPLDLSPGSQTGKIGYAGTTKAPVSRLGGSTFVMDDGDVNGQNELVRIRTRTGHQILLHNSSDLIYIGNSKGSAWIELTSNGKIDVYAEDSISMHTRGDFNLRADRDFNLEAGRNFNMASATGEININAQTNLNVIANKMKLDSLSDFNLTTGIDTKIKAGGSFGIRTAKDINTSAGGVSSHGSTGKYSIASAAVTAIKGGSDLSLSSDATVIIYAPTVKIRANPATPPTAPVVPSLDVPTPLNLFSVPQRSSSAGWSDNNFYKTIDVLSIMQRIPSHEPWDQHENIKPAQFTLDRTDSAISSTSVAENGSVIPGAPSASPAVPFKAGPGKDRGTVGGVPVQWTTDQPFLTKVKAVSALLGFDSIDLLAIMNLESNRTFDPAITNNLGYTGLIQFGTAAATDLGTTTAFLRQLSRVNQMDWVYKYFHNLWFWPNAKCPSPTLANLYLTVLLPAFRFAPPDKIIADSSDPKTAKYYFNNPGFDPGPSKLGYFTPAMVQLVVEQHIIEVQRCLANAGVQSDLIVPTK